MEDVMLTVEHVAAEALRHQRLKAYAVRSPRGDGLRWLLEWVGLRAVSQKS
jgi:hypothetical protein